MQAREDFHKAGGAPSPDRSRPPSAAGSGARSRARAQGRSKVRLGALPFLVSLACGGADEAPSEAARTATSTEVPTVSEPRPPAGHAWVIFGADTVLVEVAATSDERAAGLMYRDEVPDGTGMLFVFPDVSVRSFWMANTYVPLDLAFLDTSFDVVDVIQMQPLVTESYTSRAPAMYGLEVRQGWLAEHGIGVGARAEVVFGALGR